MSSSSRSRSNASARTAPVGSAKTVRCAIYTRKSTEEGLDQAFNSLDAQREACAAYIASQRHEGWVPTAELYDDGGYSGGNMDRPGLTQLIADVRAGKVDVIIVYKVDRLTRALSDFAKIVEVLDAAGASFVSVTQSFNTTTSMGRLTLNVLLSFAQFEREVTGERIRDKIAASKKKGMWMGGPVPLGYDVEERKLVVNEAEAQTVRHIFSCYLQLGSVRDLALDLRRAAITTKRRPLRDGGSMGGTAFGRGGLVHLLRNPAYIGKVRHHDLTYDGEHPAIVDVQQWEAAQRMLDDNSVDRPVATNVRHPSLLAGLVYDGLGRRMTPSHANKGARRFRYYITHDDSRIQGGLPKWRLPAEDLEQIVVARLTAWLRTIGDTVVAEQPDADAAHIVAIQHAGASVADQLDAGSASEQQACLRNIVERIDVRESQVDITVAPEAKLGPDMIINTTGDRVITAPATRVRRGDNVRLIMDGGCSATNRDDSLIALMAEARAAREQLLASADGTLDEVAARHGHSRRHFSRLVRLGWIAPDIVGAILDGRQPVALTRLKMLTADDLPLGWDEQRTKFGFVSAR